MSYRGSRALAVASAAALTALTLAGGTPALASQAHPAGTSPPGSASRQVMLATGDVVTLTTQPSGKQTAAVYRAHKDGPGGQFQEFTEGKDLYVVPESAVPYLHSTLSLSMFDVTQLARAEHGTMTLDVTLRLRQADGRVALPGITVTHRSGRTASGRLTETSARAFGAALAAQSLRDHASVTHTTGLFADVANIAPRGAAAAAARTATRPAYQMYTLTLKGIDQAGKKDTGDLVLLYNVNNVLKYSGEPFFDHGQAKVSVPAGHYSAICFFYNFNTGAVAAVTLPQFAVTGDGASATIDARTATAPVSVSTPRPASPQLTEVAVGRGDSRGLTGSSSFLGGSTTTFKVTPVTRHVATGQLYYYVYSRMYSPSSARSPYTYDVEFPDTGSIPASEHFTAQPATLTSIATSYPASHRNTAALDTRFGALPWQSILFASDMNLTTPTARTEYYSADPDLSWESVYYSVFDSSTFALEGEFDSSWTTYQGGTSSSTTFGGSPAIPRLLQTPLYVNQVYCPACLNGSTLNLLAFPFSDSSPLHRSYPDGRLPGLTESEHYDVYADGIEAARGTGFLEKKVTLPTGTHNVRIDYDTVRSSSRFTLSTSTDTTWTVHTGAPEGILPGGWVCNASNSTKCGVLPLMYADYSLPTSLLGQIAPGHATASVNLGHLSGASDVAVTALTASVSFNGGKSWRKATVSPAGDGRYAIAFTVPAKASTDGFGALKLSAADAYGGTFSQTTQHAFAVAGS